MCYGECVKKSDHSSSWMVSHVVPHDRGKRFAPPLEQQLMMLPLSDRPLCRQSKVAYSALLRMFHAYSVAQARPQKRGWWVSGSPSASAVFCC